MRRMVVILVYMSKSSSLLISTVRSGLSALNISKEDSGKVIVIFSEVVLPVLAKAIQEGAVVEKARYGKKEKNVSVFFLGKLYTHNLVDNRDTYNVHGSLWCSSGNIGQQARCSCAEHDRR